MTCAAPAKADLGQNLPINSPIRAQFKKTSDQKKLTQLLVTHSRILAHGGSRSGKTFEFVRAICVRALKAAGSRHLITRFHFRDAKIAVFMDTLPKVMAVCFPELKEGVNFWYNKTDYFLKFQNGSEIWIGGLDDKERVDKILGLEYATIYFNESSQISFHAIETALTRLAQKTILKNKVYFDCNPPTKSHWLYLYFFKKLNPVTKLPHPYPDLYAELQMNPEGNRANLPDDYIEVELGSLSERKRKRFKEGAWLDDLEGALWKRAWIDNNRVVSHPELRRIVIAIDPAVTSNANSNATGITVQGIDTRNPAPHFYVIADRTVESATPMEWGNAAINAFHEFKADLMVGEVNNGGELVERNIKAIDPNIPFKMVHASRGKIIRAEPIANLYEQGRVHHVGELPELEDEQCSYSPQMEEEGKNSPNHLDACVWGLTVLSGGTTGQFRAAGRKMENKHEN